MSRLLTVGLPVYNSMPYLRETMDSLFAQTFRDFKILAIVEDCEDGSVEYMESLRDSRLRIIRQPKTSLVQALNQMLRETDTAWMVRQDTDDISYPNRLERLAHWIERKPDAGMFYSLAEYYPKDQCVGQFRCTRGTPEELRQIVKSGYLLAFCHPTVALNTRKTLAIGGYNEELHEEDMDLWWRMAMDYDIQYIPEILVGYRQHSGSLTTHNLVRSYIEGLYDQYLLLSHLHGWQPLPLDAVREPLSSFASMRDLSAKEKLREMNILLSKKRYPAATLAGLKSFTTSPNYFSRRVIDELRQGGPITNGINPRRFLRRKGEFWPDGADARGSVDSRSADPQVLEQELRETSLVGTLAINRLRVDEAIQALLRHVRRARREGPAGNPLLVFGVNAQVATLVKENRRFAEAVASAAVMYPDGISVVIASHLLGRPLNSRIPGGEFMELLCKEGAKEGLSAYFLGGLPGAAEKTAQILKARYPGLRIAGARCPRYNFESDPEESAQIVKSIQESAPDMLFVGLGVPKQELWIANHSAVLPVGLAFPVGAALDTTSGLRRRAPVWARRTGTEWLYRLAKEPRRLWRRYLIGNTAFAMMIFTQWMRERRQRPFAPGD